MKNYFSPKGFSLIELSIVVLIIGILIGGISGSNKIITKSQIQFARSITKSSPVNSIKDLLLWYETSLEESFLNSEASDGSSISVWKDINPQSTDKINATVYNGSVTYKERVFGGISGVYFNGSGGALQHDNTALIGSNFTVFFVEFKKSLSATLGASYVVGGMGNASNTVLAFYYNNSGGFASGLRLSMVPVYNNSEVSEYKPVMHSFTFSKTDGMKYWANGGTNPDSSDATKINPLINPTYNITKIGNFFYNDHRYAYNGYIAEYIIFTRDLLSSERMAVEKYLSHKYKITITG